MDDKVLTHVNMELNEDRTKIILSFPDAESCREFGQILVGAFESAGRLQVVSDGTDD